MAKNVTVPRRHSYANIIRQYQIIPYDSDNLYPQRMANIFASSGAATVNAKWLAKFINGQGMEDLAIYKKKINRKGQTVDHFLRKMIQSYVKFGSFAVHFNYNMLGEKTEMQIVPFEYVRMETDSEEVRFTGRFKIYNDWDKQKRKAIRQDNIISIYDYDLNTVIDEIEKVGIQNYTGQLYYFWQEYGSYPLSLLDSESESAVVDSEIKEFNFSNVTTGFLGAHTFEFPFEFETQEAREQQEEHLQDFQGARHAQKILMLENKNPENPIKITEIKSSSVDNMFLNTEKSVRERIRKLYEVPVAFLEAIPGSLGANDIANAYQFYNAITEDYRIMFEEVLTELFRGWHEPISEQQNFKIKPLEYGDKAIETDEDNIQAAALNGAQVTALVEIVSAKNQGILSREAAIELITSAFPLISKEQAEKIVSDASTNNIAQLS